MKTRPAEKLFTPLVFLLAVAGSPPATESRGDLPRKGTAPAADSMHGKEAGQVRDDNGLKMKLVWCPPGKFTMGSPAGEIGAKGRHHENENQVSVTLTRGVWLGKYEVTQQEYERTLEKNPSAFSATGKDSEDVAGMETHDFPVERVSYDDALDFCTKLTEQERRSGRLPL